MSADTNYRRRRHRTSVEDTKAQKFLKLIFSFVIFVFLTALSVLICVRSVVFNPYYIEKSLTSYEYTMELYKNIDDFSRASCKKADIGTQAVERAVTFEEIKRINDAYVSEKLKTESRFNNETYDYFISDFETTFKELLLQQMETENVSINDTVQSGMDELIKEIIAYIDTSVSISHAADLHSFASVADTALKIASIVLAVLTGALAVIVSYVGEKRYRGIRYLAYSAGAAALINMAFAVIAYAFYKSADLAIQPLYLQYALENHISNSIFALLCASFSLFAVYTVILAWCWKLKRKNK